MLLVELREKNAFAPHFWHIFLNFAANASALRSLDKIDLPALAGASRIPKNRKENTESVCGIAGDKALLPKLLWTPFEIENENGGKHWETVGNTGRHQKFLGRSQIFCEHEPTLQRRPQNTGKHQDTP